MNDGVEGARRAHIAIRTYLSTGIRLAFSPGLRDESKLSMGGEEFIETLPPDLRVGAHPLVFFDKEALADSYFRTMAGIAAWSRKQTPSYARS